MDSGNIIEINIVNMGSILIMGAVGALILAFLRKSVLAKKSAVGNAPLASVN